MKKLISTNKKRGFSLAEVIVAMAVIVLVTGASIMLIGSHTKLQATTVQNIRAANIAENAIECFRYADGVETFKTVFFENVVNVVDEECREINEGEWKTSFEFDSNGVEVIITIDGSTIKVKAGNIEQTFTKSVAQ